MTILSYVYNGNSYAGKAAVIMDDKWALEPSRADNDVIFFVGLWIFLSECEVK